MKIFKSLVLAIFFTLSWNISCQAMKTDTANNEVKRANSIIEKRKKGLTAFINEFEKEFAKKYKISHDERSSNKVYSEYIDGLVSMEIAWAEFTIRLHNADNNHARKDYKNKKEANERTTNIIIKQGLEHFGPNKKSGK